MKWHGNRREPGPYRLTVGMGNWFRLEVRQVMVPGRKPWGDRWDWEVQTSSGLLLISGECDDGEQACAAAENALLMLCLDTLKEFRK